MPASTSLPAVGVGLPIVGRYARPDAVDAVATAADRLGFASISLAERILLPAADGWSNDFGLPESPSYDAIETLTWVAARTTGIRLRTDVLIPLFQQPVVLARRLATLDHLSGGRLDVGVGLGWMPEEFAATGVGATGKAARFEECVRAIRACWGPDPVEFDGVYYRIPRARIGPKPTNGTIRIDIGAVARPAVERASRLGDGLTIGFRNWDATIEQIGWYREAGGTGPVVARAGPMLVDAEHTTAPSTWGEASIVDDLRRAAELGIGEILWDLNIVERPPDVQIAALERLAATLSLTPRG